MMKKRVLIFTALCFAFLSAVTAQEKYDDFVKIGDELVIGNASKANYRFIDVPRKNFIIKKGGIANIKSLAKTRVKVTKKEYNRNNETVITIERSNGAKFFNAYRTLKADLNGAIANGELQIENTEASGEIAK